MTNYELGGGYYSSEGAAVQTAREIEHKENELTVNEREILVSSNLDLSRIITNQLLNKAPNRFLREDMIQAGLVGLVKAAQFYNPSKNTKFRTYADRLVRGAILDFLREYDPLTRDTRKLVNKLKQIEKELGDNFDITDEEILAAKLGLDLNNWA